MRYHARFHGRTKGAIGFFYPLNAFVEADTADAAHLKLYDTFEHITLLRLTPQPEQPEQTDNEECDRCNGRPAKGDCR